MTGLGRRSGDGLVEDWLLGVPSPVSLWLPWCSEIAGRGGSEGVLLRFRGSTFSLSLSSTSLS